jgi:hypothetical protein
MYYTGAGPSYRTDPSWPDRLSYRRSDSQITYGGAGPLTNWLPAGWLAAVPAQPISPPFSARGPLSSSLASPWTPPVVHVVPESTLLHSANGHGQAGRSVAERHPAGEIGGARARPSGPQWPTGVQTQSVPTHARLILSTPLRARVIHQPDETPAKTKPKPHTHVPKS